MLSKEEIKIFLGEVFSEIVPETYFTDAGTEEIFAQAEQNGYYDFEDHGKFRMSLLKKQNTTDEGEVFIIISWVSQAMLGNGSGE